MKLTPVKVPPSKRVRALQDEEAEQLQPITLDSVETTTTGETMQEDVYAHV